MSDSFSSIGVPADLVACLDALGLTEPYPIQSATVPEALRGRDVFAQSPTGSGKTLAFALPLVSRIGKADRRRPRGLVLAPTRELAAQIAKVIRPLAEVKHRRVATFYGGTGYKEQLSALHGGVDIVVGCPGRLIDLLDRRALDLTDVEVAVIDEADRMADMGFLPVVRRLLDEVGHHPQTMLFSATRTRDVERLVRDYQVDAERHILELPTDDVGSRTHEFWKSTREGRSGLTARLVASHGSSIVFCRTKRGVDRLTKQLTQSGISAVAIHGDRSQSQRDRALEQFRGRRAQVLVGTDVASRGIHVEGVDCVLHYDPPEDEDTYVHRSGRTGRAGASGRVVSLVCPDQERAAKALQQRLRLGTRLLPPPALGEVSRSDARTSTGSRAGAHTGDNTHPGTHTGSRAGAHTGDGADARAGSSGGNADRGRRRSNGSGGRPGQKRNRRVSDSGPARARSQRRRKPVTI